MANELCEPYRFAAISARAVATFPHGTRTQPVGKQALISQSKESVCK
jgi:hypothetical protein